MDLVVLVGMADRKGIDIDNRSFFDGQLVDGVIIHSNPWRDIMAWPISPCNLFENSINVFEVF